MVRVQQYYISTEKYFCMAGKRVTKVTQTNVRRNCTKVTQIQANFHCGIEQMVEFRISSRDHKNIISSTSTSL